MWPRRLARHPILTIVGAGPGLGLSLARRFGSEGFIVALVSRDQARLDKLVALLCCDGITAQGHEADVTDPASLTPQHPEHCGTGC